VDSPLPLCARNSPPESQFCPRPGSPTNCETSTIFQNVGHGRLTGPASRFGKLPLGRAAQCFGMRDYHATFGRYGRSSLSPTTRRAPHLFRTRSDHAETQRTRSISNENAIESTKLNSILPLITVWLQVRVLRGPPRFALRQKLCEGRFWTPARLQRRSRNSRCGVGSSSTIGPAQAIA
jgi:hypothetical protein